jgi:hypothetical protein
MPINRRLDYNFLAIELYLHDIINLEFKLYYLRLSFIDSNAYYIIFSIESYYLLLVIYSNAFIINIF